VFETTKGGGVLPGSSEGLKDSGVTPQPDSVKQAQEVLEQAAEHLREALQKVPALKALEDRIEITVTAEGLRIELLENEKNSFFAVGSAQLLPETVELLGVIAKELSPLGNKIALEGHTDSRAYGSRNGYTNWELSTDRANASRRELLNAGLDPARIARVVGLADTDPLVPQDPTSAQNRRISIVLMREAPLAEALVPPPPKKVATDPATPPKKAELAPTAPGVPRKLARE
jgi:chemotaxis protein MotB